MRATNFLTALILILTAAGCLPVDKSAQEIPAPTPAAVSEQAAAVDTAMETDQQAAGSGTPKEGSGQVRDGDAPLEPTVQTGTDGAPADTPEPTAASSSPTDTPILTGSGAEGQIYAAAVRQVYNVDFSFGDSAEFPLVYIATITDDGSLLEAPFTPEQKMPPDLLHAIEAELADQPFEIIWVESRDEVPVSSPNDQIAGGEGIYIKMGNILPQHDGTVQMPFFMSCGSMCSLGKIYVLSEVDGAWQVTGSVGMEIIS